MAAIVEQLTVCRKSGKSTSAFNSGRFGFWRTEVGRLRRRWLESPERRFDEAATHDGFHDTVTSQYVTVVILCNRSYDAVYGGTNRLASLSQEAINLGGPKIERQAQWLQESELFEEHLDFCPALVSSQSLKDLADDDSTGTEIVRPFQEKPERRALAGSVVVRKGHPCGGID